MAIINRTILLIALTLTLNVQALERIKDIASIAGVRSNQLVGYGLVVGLNGTGDKAGQTFTDQSFATMLTRLGITIPPGTKMDSKNIAAVIVTADIDAFAKPGHRIDVTVSSIGSAKSLRGGALLLTPLKGINGKVYAIAQGNLIVGGLGVSGKDGSKITRNVPSVGRVPGGATVEKAIKNPFNSGETITFNVHRPDFTTTKRLARRINEIMGPETAEPVDAVSVKVKAPMQPAKRVEFVSVLENIKMKSGRAAAKVIVNARRGTVVIGQDVEVDPVAVSHGNLTVTISEEPNVSQPGALSGGETVVTADSKVEVEQDVNSAFIFGPGTSLDDIVKAVNSVGATPGDLAAILEAMKQVGALKAELIVI